MKDRTLLILIPLIIIFLLLTALKFNNKEKSTKLLTQKEKFIIIYNKLKSYDGKNTSNNQHIDEYKKNILEKYNISSQEWDKFLYKLNKNKNYLHNYLDLLESR